MAVTKGSIVTVLTDPEGNDGDDTAPAIVTRADETQTLNHPTVGDYDVTASDVRAFLNTDGIPRWDDVRVINWESDARTLAAGDPEHQYGFVRPGVAPPR